MSQSDVSLFPPVLPEHIRGYIGCGCIPLIYYSSAIFAFPPQPQLALYPKSLHVYNMYKYLITTLASNGLSLS